MNDLTLTWTVAAHPTPDAPPAATDAEATDATVADATATGAAVTDDATWAPATVPGAVQLDLAAHLGYGPWWYADNWRDYLWMEDSCFTYRTTFARPDVPDGGRVTFRSRGIDYRFRIALNGEQLHEQEGMFTPVALDLTPHLRDHNELTVLILPAPKSHHTGRDRTQADQSVKPAVSYGWDFHPRLVPLGIWDETGVVVEPAVSLDDVRCTYRLAEDLASATGTLEVSGRGLAGRRCAVELIAPDGTTAFRQEIRAAADDVAVPFTLAQPRLWWPVGEGDQSRYTARAVVVPDDVPQVAAAPSPTPRHAPDVHVLDDVPAPDAASSLSRRIGFRRVRLVMNEGAWDEPSTFPKTRSVPPIQLEVNGRRIFVRGSNWVPPEVFYGTLTRERYAELIDLAVHANLNLLRVWGGGIVNKESFHELCDERGLLVWQEFPLACNDYRGTDDYLDVLEREATSIVRRLAQHPSTALWCGGNELFNAWSGMTDQSLALRLLGALCYRLDPQTPFIATSPLMGMGHGHYVLRDDVTGAEVFRVMPGAGRTAYSEFGVSSPADVDVLRSITPPEDLWPPRGGTAWETHHAFGQWAQDAWLRQAMIEHYLGPQADLEELVGNGQLLQSVGYQFMFEEARRQKPYCSMALNWCLNEPWPTAAGNAILSYPARPKPSFAAVRAACRPALASARVRRLVWAEGEEFAADLFVLNDAPVPVPAGTLAASIRSADPAQEETPLLEWPFPAAEPGRNVVGPRVRWRLPRLPGDRFTLVLRVADRPELDSEYVVLYRPRAEVADGGVRGLGQ